MISNQLNHFLIFFCLQHVSDYKKIKSCTLKLEKIIKLIYFTLPLVYTYNNARSLLHYDLLYPMEYFIESNQKIPFK